MYMKHHHLCSRFILRVGNILDVDKEVVLINRLIQLGGLLHLLEDVNCVDYRIHTCVCDNRVLINIHVYVITEYTYTYTYIFI